MFYNITSKRVITQNLIEHVQLLTVSWRHAVDIATDGALKTASAIWAGLIDDLDPTGSTHSAVEYTQVLSIPDSKKTLSITSPKCNAVVTAVDLQSHSAPCTFILKDSTTSSLRDDIIDKVGELLNLSMPSARALITTINITVKEA